MNREKNSKQKLKNKLSPENANNRDREFKGQPHTSYGKRGETEIKGITFRDLADAYIKGVLLSTSNSKLYESVEKGTWKRNDIYKIDWDDIDPGAIQQNMHCEVEKMMGIFPNLPKSKRKVTKGVVK